MSSNSQTTEISNRDRSCEASIHLDNVRAIADLIFTVCGSEADGSGSRIGELCPTTIYSAMDCISRNIDAAERLHDEMARDMLRRLRAAEANAGH